MDVNTLFSNLNSLKGEVSWDLITIQELISEIAVISKNPTSDNVLPLVLAVLDKVKDAALEKVPQGKSSDEVLLHFDELKILAKHFVPVVISAVAMEAAAVKGCSCFSWFRSSGKVAPAAVDPSKTTDQKVQEPEKVGAIVSIDTVDAV